MSHPEWLAQSPGNVKASLWFWWKNNLNILADRDDCKAVTRKVNGGLNGYSQRAYWTRMAKKELC
jgi:putative chitinase